MATKLERTITLEMSRLVRSAIRIQAFLENALESFDVKGASVRWEPAEPWEKLPQKAVLVVLTSRNHPREVTFSRNTIEGFHDEPADGPTKRRLLLVARASARPPAARI